MKDAMRDSISTLLLAALLLFTVGCKQEEPASSVKNSPAAKPNGTETTDSKPAPPDKKPTETKPKDMPEAKPAPKSNVETPKAKVSLDATARDWIAKLANPDQKQKDQAQVWLDEQGAKSTELLLAGLADDKDDVRIGAAYGLLGVFNQFEPRVVAGLLSALHDPNDRVRGFAVTAATEMNPEMLGPALGDLAVIVGDPSNKAHVRAQAARVLGTLGSEAFAPLSTAFASATDRALRTACLNALVQAAPSGEAATKVLQVVVAKDKDLPLRRIAVARLGELGPEASGAIEPLAAALGDADERLRKGAAAALMRIGPATVPALAQQVESKNSAAQLAAIEALGEFGAAAKSAIPALKTAAGSKDKSVRDAAQRALQLVEGAK